MGSSKRSTNKRSKDKNQHVKKKKIKKLGLAKFLPTNRPQPKKKTDQSGVTDDVESQSNLEKKTVLVRDDKKNLTIVDKCKLQMSSSMLRLIDEALYNSEARSISIDKDKFLAYHKAYASVCNKWPIKPIDFIVKFIKKRLIVRKPIHKLKFADVGCGVEPLLKKKLPPKAKVLSFDLVSAHEDVIEANMEKLPLDNASVHCVVYSLSLMAKNLGNIIIEGKRVLKTAGSMLIVEVTSRFEGNEKKFIAKMEKLGLKQKSMRTLEPNGYFTFFHFSKMDDILDYSSSALNIQLKPCTYKSR